MGASYVPIQQPYPIQTISFNRLSPNSVEISINGEPVEPVVANITETIGKTVTRSDNRICIKNRREQLKYIFPLSALTSINGVAWTGTNVYNAVRKIIAAVFGGDGDTLGKFNQTITVVTPASVAHTAPAFQLVGSTDSGLPITWSSSNTAIFTVSGTGLLTPVSAGTANILANQAGDGNYNAATQVTTPYTLT